MLFLKKKIRHGIFRDERVFTDNNTKNGLSILFSRTRAEHLTSFVLFQSLHNLMRWLLLELSLSRGGNQARGKKNSDFPKAIHLARGGDGI